MKLRILQIAAGFIYLPFLFWCLLAIWFDGPSRPWLAALLIVLLLAGLIASFVWIRPYRRLALAAIAPIIAVIAWWLLIPPSNDRDWQPDVARLPSAEFNGTQVTIHNIRNFHYRTTTDYDEKWETRTYDLNKLVGTDLFLSRWGPKNIAHTIVSWEFSDGQHLACSIETRKEVGESYSAVRGFFRQFEIYYVVADERDLVGLRAAYRGEHVSLFHLKHPPEVARAMLEDYLRTINQLVQKPEWYNALTDNCTTSIRHHAKAVGAAGSLDWRLLANGHLDEMGYERGFIDTSMPLDELRRVSDISERGKAAIADPDFSARIREGLPGAH